MKPFLALSTVSANWTVVHVFNSKLDSYKMDFVVGTVRITDQDYPTVLLSLHEAD